VVVKYAWLWIRKILSLVPIIGLRATLKESFPHLLWIEKVHRLEKDLQIPEEETEPRIPTEVVATSGRLSPDWGGEEEIRRIRGGFGCDQFKVRLKRGDILFCGYSGGNFVGFIWLKMPPVSGAGSKLGDDEAYMIDGWVFEPYRGKRLLSTLQQAVFNYVRKERPDIRTIVSHAATWHKVSLAGQQRAGFVITARELSLVFFGYRKNWTLESLAA